MRDCQTRKPMAGGSSSGVEPAAPRNSMARGAKTVLLLQLVFGIVLFSCAELAAAAPLSARSKVEPVTSAHPPGSLAEAAVPAKSAAAWLSNTNLLNLSLIIIILFMGIMLLRKFIPAIIEYLSPQLQVLGILPTSAGDAWPKTLAEEEEISKFVVGFRAGPALAPTAAIEPVSAPVARVPLEAIKENNRAERNLLKEFFDWMPGQMMDLRYLLEKVNRSAGGTKDKSAVREKLCDLSAQVRSLKGKAGLPELLPVWQMASALDGLIKQLIDRADTINSSTLRTITGGIEVLGELCMPELRVDIATNPTIQILAVDDDPVSRFALTSSVKKIFNPPDLAEQGDAALAMVSKQTYDIIFLDVSMPGMDGFEVCSRIHQTELNRTTPVVFVTSLKDFESQATALVSGGCDLIGKPFLTFEIAVKALTLVMHNRLKGRDRVVEASNATAGSEMLPSGPHVSSVRPAVEVPVALLSAANSNPVPNPLEEPNPDFHQATPVGSSHPAFSSEFLTNVSASLAEVQNEVREIGQTLEDTKRQEKLVTLHLRIQSLTRQMDRPELRPAFQLCSALQGLLKKLQEKPASAGASTLDTVTVALAVLNDLCQPGVKPDLAVTPAISILVVDDEPLSRRAVVGAIQTAFLKPDSAEHGQAALALATEKTFDVIFLDVEMPGMDGFQVCAKIHETELNRATPVVFVTSHKDFKSRAQSARSGGSDFVVKPFLFVEITVKALTFALRNRLQKLGKESLRQSDAQKTF